MSQVPTPPSIGNWSIHLESQEDEKSQSGTSINIPGIGECSVSYIESQGTYPPETLNQSLTSDSLDQSVYVLETDLSTDLSRIDQPTRSQIVEETGLKWPDRENGKIHLDF